MSDYPQLDEAFRKLKQKGTSDEEIRRRALAQGWTDAEITAALQVEMPVPPPPKQAPVSQEAEAPALPRESVPKPVTEPVTVEEKESPKAKPAPKAHHMASMWILVSVGFLLVVLGTAAGAAYFLYGFNPFAQPPYTEENFTSALLDNLSKIESGESRVKFSAYTQAREADAKPFAIEIPDTAEIEARYMRDYERADAVMDIRTELAYGTLNDAGEQIFPESLESYQAAQDPNGSLALRGFPTDPLTLQSFVYRQSESGADYELDVTFETEEAIQAIRNAYTFNDTEPRINGLTVTFTKDSPQYFFVSEYPPKSFFEQVNEFTAFLSDDFAFSGELTALKEKAPAEGDVSSGSIQVDIQGDLDDLTYHVNAEVRVVEGALYFIVNNLPGIFSGMIPKEQWVRLDTETGDEVSFIDVPELEEKYRATHEAYERYKQTVVRIADQSKLISFKQEPKRELADGTLRYLYDLQLNKDAVVPFYTALLEATQNDEAFKEYAPYVTQAHLQALQSDSFNEIFDYYVQNTSLRVWVTQEGVPVQINYALRVVPPDENTKMQDKQIVVEFTFVFDRVNEDIQIEAPEGVRSYEEAMEESMFAGSLGEARVMGTDAAIQASMNNLRAQAEIVGSQADGTVDYSGTCTDATVVSILTDIEEKAGKTQFPYCFGSAEAWVIAAPLKSENRYMCVDSTGYSELYDGEVQSTGEMCL